jgi:hypothetical protein
MIKSYLFLFLSLSLISCGKSGGGGKNTNETADAASTTSDSSNITATSPVPSSALTWDANITFTNFTRTQENKVLDAADLVKQVIASSAFKSRILNHTYKGKKTFVDNLGLSNAKIYKKILESSEKLNPGKNYTMDITLATYQTDANVIGYTLPNVNKVWMNTRYLNKFTPVQVSSNLVHEWLHKLGFGHDYESTPSRPYSVPYAVGSIIKSLAAKY